jgi:hypothetical protein
VTKNDVLSCPNCSATHTVQLREATFLFCDKCRHLVASRYPTEDMQVSDEFPEDWTFIQIGTVGKYKDHPFKITGRVRLQLRNDYKNFWCAEHKNGHHLWIIESFASFCIFSEPWKRYSGQANTLHAGALIEVGEPKQLVGEYVEKCEAIQYGGELGPWKIFHAKFFVVQAARRNDAAMFLINHADDISFLFGEKVNHEELELTNTVTWNEWK